MIIIEFFLIYIVYLFLILAGYYYINLFISKEQYSKDELKNILPYFSQLWNKISSSYSILTLCIILLVLSIIGILIPMVSSHWIFNSSILFVVLFFVLPYLKKHYEKAQVAESDQYSDTVVNIFIKYTSIVLIGFGTGLGCALIYNWRSLININSLWFLLNIIVVSILLGITLNNLMKE